MNIPSDENLNPDQAINVAKYGCGSCNETNVSPVCQEQGPSTLESKMEDKDVVPEPAMATQEDKINSSPSDTLSSLSSPQVQTQLHEKNNSENVANELSNPTVESPLLKSKEAKAQITIATCDDAGVSGDEKGVEKANENDSTSLPYNTEELQEHPRKDTEQQQNESLSNVGFPTAGVAPEVTEETVSEKTLEDFAIVEVKPPRSDTSNSSIYSSIDGAASNLIKTDSQKAFYEKLSQDSSDKITERISSLSQGSFKKLELFHHQFVGELQLTAEDPSMYEDDSKDVITSGHQNTDEIPAPVANDDVNDKGANSSEKGSEEISGIVNKYIDFVEQDYKSKRDLWKEQQKEENSGENNGTGENSSIYSYSTFQDCVLDKKIPPQVPFELIEAPNSNTSDSPKGKFEFKKRGSSTRSRSRSKSPTATAARIPVQKNVTNTDSNTEYSARILRMRGNKESLHDLREEETLQKVVHEKPTGADNVGKAAPTREEPPFVGNLSEDTRSQISVMMSGIFTAVSQTSIERSQEGEFDETKAPLTSAEKIVSNFVRRYICFLEREWKRRRSLWLEENSSQTRGQLQESPYFYESFVECVANNRIQLQVPFELPDYRHTPVDKVTNLKSTTNISADQESNKVPFGVTFSDTEDVDAKKPDSNVPVVVLEEHLSAEESKDVEKNVIDSVSHSSGEEVDVNEHVSEPTRRASWWNKMFFPDDADDLSSQVKPPLLGEDNEEAGDQESIVGKPIEIDSMTKDIVIPTTEVVNAYIASSSTSLPDDGNMQNLDSAFSGVQTAYQMESNIYAMQLQQKQAEIPEENSKDVAADKVKLEDIQSKKPASSDIIDKKVAVEKTERKVIPTKAAPAKEKPIPTTTAVTKLAKEGVSEKSKIADVSAESQYKITINGRVVVCSSMDQKTRLEVCALKLNAKQAYASNLKDISVLPGEKILPYMNLTDFKNCRLVCKAWNNGIIGSKQFLSNTNFVIEKKPLGCLATLEASKVGWQNLRCSMLPSMNLTASSTYNGRFISSNLRLNSRSEPITNTVSTVIFESMEINKQQLVQWIQNCKRLSTIIVRNCNVQKSTISVHMDKANRVMEKVQVMKFSDMHPVKLAEVLRFFLPATRRLHTLEIIQRKETKGNTKSTTFTARKGAEEEIGAVLSPALKKNRQTLRNFVVEFTSTKNYLIQRKIVETLGSEAFQLNSLVVHSYIHANSQPCLKMDSYGSASTLSQLIRGTLKGSTEMKYLDFPMLAIDFKKGVEDPTLLPSKLEKLSAQLEIPLQEENCPVGITFDNLKELELYGTSSLDNAQWRHVKKAMPNLTQLDVQSSGMKDSNLQSIIHNLKHLKVLRLQNVADITDFGITGAEVGWIERLKMYWPERYDQIPKDKVRFAGKPLAAMTDLHTFSMSGNFSISNVGILFGFNSQNITTLELNGSAVNVSNSGLFILGFQCPRLQRIQMVVQHSKANPSGIQHLFDSLTEKLPSQFHVDLLPPLELQPEMDGNKIPMIH